MKSLLALSCLLVAVTIVQGDITDAYIEGAKDAFDECAKELGLSGKNRREIFDKDATGGLESASCFRACVMKKMNMLKDNQLNLEVLGDFVKSVNANQPEKVAALLKHIEHCNEKAKVQSDNCKLAFSYVSCFLDKH
ncbi:general odorant-binding protein 19d-like [Calliopsis andreniformis]|uniref:general odorant-binding protein 19d-like n=1 Tax=Calliopsis andreniformis TaxID=337506 RepID=UPI003FCD41E9